MGAGVFLFFSNSPSVSILLSVLISLAGGLMVLSSSGSSLPLLLSVLVFSGGVFVIMSFVVFSSEVDVEKSFGKSQTVLACLSFFLVVSNQTPLRFNPSETFHLSGSYLVVFVFILITLLIFLYSISSLSEESGGKH